MSEWQPIETAPLDADVWLYGTAELWVGSTPFHWQGVGGWDPEFSAWLTNAHDDKGQCLYIKATHWMPLPDAPITP